MVDINIPKIVKSYVPLHRSTPLMCVSVRVIKAHLFSVTRSLSSDSGSFNRKLAIVIPLEIHF